MKTPTTPPGPRGAAILRTVLRRRTDPIGLMKELSATYGGIVDVRVGNTSHLLISDPAAAHHVLVDNHTNYPKGPGYALLGRVLGRGLVTSDGAHWRDHRRIVQPVLRKERMAGSVAIIAEAVEEEANELEVISRRSDSIDVFGHITRLALRIAARAFLGSDVRSREDEVCRSLNTVFAYVQRLSASPLRALEFLPGAAFLRPLGRAADWLPNRARRAFDDALDTLDEVIHEVITRRRSEGDGSQEPTDLVGRLLRASARGTDGPALSDEDIRDEVMTMFVAGHETTATGVTWCLYLLARHPQYQQQIAAEAEAAVGDRAVSWEDLPGLPTAQRVFQEAIRLYPPVWRISRHARESDQLGGFHVPSGSVVIISPYLMHHDPTNWPDPERFDPGRFDPATSELRSMGRYYLPFGAGQRMCPGGSFSTAEAQVILATLCRRFVFQPVPTFEPSFEPRLTLRPKGGMPLRLVATKNPGSISTTTVHTT